eukprot:764667-Hanusia_phi.AAC.4
MGHGLEQGITIGPLISDAGASKVDRLISFMGVEGWWTGGEAGGGCEGKGRQGEEEEDVCKLADSCCRSSSEESARSTISSSRR